MTYEVTCPQGHRVQVTDSHFGERVHCPTCNESFVVPDLKGRGQAWSNPPPPVPDTGVGYRHLLGPESLSWLSFLSGRPMVAIGLILVLMARGCDAIGKRGVDRAVAKEQAAKDRFADEWERTQLDLKDKIAALEEKKEPKAEDQKAVAELKTQLADVATRQDKAKKALESGEWRALKIDAREAEVNHKINGYWREMFFVFASIVLALGLLTVSWTAEGAERWVSLIMLAIITFSIYIGGTAWMPLGRM